MTSTARQKSSGKKTVNGKGKKTEQTDLDQRIADAIKQTFAVLTPKPQPPQPVSPGYAQYQREQTALHESGFHHGPPSEDDPAPLHMHGRPLRDVITLALGSARDLDYEMGQRDPEYAHYDLTHNALETLGFELAALARLCADANDQTEIDQIAAMLARMAKRAIATVELHDRLVSAAELTPEQLARAAKEGNEVQS